MKRKAKWFVKRASDDRMLCVDGLWRSYVAGIEDIKFYTSIGRAHKYGLKHQDGTAYAVYDGDEVDRDGIVYRGVAA